MSDARRTEVLQQLRGIIEASEDLRSSLRVTEVTAESRFKEDLGFDSLGMMSLVYELQELYPELDEAEGLRWKRVSDCLDKLA